MASSRKIRVALIGLSAPPKGSPTGTSWAANGHLPYLTASDKYQVVALQNSSVHRAAEAIKAFSLNPDTTRAYGTPEGKSSSQWQPTPLGMPTPLSPL